MKPANVLVVHFEPYDTLDRLKSILKKHKIAATFVARDDVKADDGKGRDFLISIGGDGTFLATARHAKEAWIFGVNSNPDDKEGFLTRATADTLEQRFEDILEDRFTGLYLSRLQVRLDGKELPLVLNEVFVAHREPHRMALYRLNVDGKSEVQKSSGIIIGTAVGSHGWLKSAGGETMPLMDRRFQWLVRDPFKGNLIETTLTNGMLDEGKKLSIEYMTDEGIIVLDGGIPRPLPKGSKLEITTSQNRLKFIDFQE